jgi:NADPH2:quinone reductase
MKAIQISAPGGPDVLAYVEVADPSPAAGEVLVRALAIGVGKPDVLFRTGVYRWMPPLPAIPGAEMSGYVEAIGSGVDQFWVGQPVLVYRFRGGCYAEKIAVPVTDVTRLPGSIDLDAAVSMPNFQVAWALLNEAARGIVPRTVYINGAAGGIGCAVIQLCKLNGTAVIAGASSDDKCTFARSQGATHTVNYAHESLVSRVSELTDGRGVDLILDHIVGKDFTDNFKILAPMGLIVSFNALGGPPERDLFKEMRANLPKSPGVRCFTMHSFDHDPETRQRIASRTVALFGAGKVTPPVHAHLHLSDARRAHEMLDAREVMGKLVLKP